MRKTVFGHLVLHCSLQRKKGLYEFSINFKHLKVIINYVIIIIQFHFYYTE